MSRGTDDAKLQQGQSMCNAEPQVYQLVRLNFEKTPDINSQNLNPQNLGDIELSKLYASLAQKCTEILIIGIMPAQQINQTPNSDHVDVYLKTKKQSQLATILNKVNQRLNP